MKYQSVPFVNCVDLNEPENHELGIAIRPKLCLAGPVNDLQFSDNWVH